MSDDKVMLCPLIPGKPIVVNGSGNQPGFIAHGSLPRECLREECAMWRRGKTGAWIATNRIAYPLNAGDEAHPVMEEEVVGYCGLAGKP